MSDSKDDHKGIWLEVSSVRLGSTEANGEQLQVQFKGDKADRGQVWWPMETGKADKEKLYQNFLEALDKKRLVLAQLCVVSKTANNKSSEVTYLDRLCVKHYRFQFSEATR